MTRLAHGAVNAYRPMTITGDLPQVEPLDRLRTPVLLVFVLLPHSAQTTLAEDARPNVLFIITDDQERREFNFLPEGCDEQGKPRNLRPHLDRLAREGIVLLNQYVTSPVCTPSGFSVLTGTYASRSSAFENTAKHDDMKLLGMFHHGRSFGYYQGGLTRQRERLSARRIVHAVRRDGRRTPKTSEGISFRPVLEGKQDTVRDVLYGV